MAEPSRDNQALGQAAGVRLRASGLLVYATVGATTPALATGDWVLVELPGGPAAGRVVVPPFPLEAAAAASWPVLRRRLTDDEVRALAARETADEATRQAVCALAGELGLAARIVAVERSDDDQWLRLVCADADAASLAPLVERLTRQTGVAVEVQPALADEIAQAVGGLGRLVLATEAMPDELAADLAAAPPLPRLNGLVMTEQGLGSVVRVQVARRLARVALTATGELVEAPVDSLRPAPSPLPDG
jgi:hypothetical protein